MRSLLNSTTVDKPLSIRLLPELWCCDLWQRYKKKAIHNKSFIYKHFPVGVVTCDKDTKRKQFTTSSTKLLATSPVLWPVTKIQKESNSQHAVNRTSQNIWCCDLWQRYKKKAIHNIRRRRPWGPRGVVTCDKDTKRKQFTTFPVISKTRIWVLWPVTKIQKESNSQRADRADTQHLRCCDLWQRYKNSWQVRKAPCVVIQACRFCVFRVWGGTSFCTGTDFSVSYLFWSFFIARHPGNRYHCGRNF